VLDLLQLLLMLVGGQLWMVQLVLDLYDWDLLRPILGNLLVGLGMGELVLHHSSGLMLDLLQLLLMHLGGQLWMVRLVLELQDWVFLRPILRNMLVGLGMGELVLHHSSKPDLWIVLLPLGLLLEGLQHGVRLADLRPVGLLRC
jgi:hypothetical protein